MKNRIKKWLGIETPKQISNIELRKMIGEALVDALENRADERSMMWCFPATFDNTLNEALKRSAYKTACEAANEAISEHIANEGFIDEVIARIRRKQLDA